MEVHSFVKFNLNSVFMYSYIVRMFHVIWVWVYSMRIEFHHFKIQTLHSACKVVLLHVLGILCLFAMAVSSPYNL